MDSVGVRNAVSCAARCPRAAVGARSSAVDQAPEQRSRAAKLDYVRVGRFHRTGHGVCLTLCWYTPLLTHSTLMLFAASLRAHLFGLFALIKIQYTFSRLPYSLPRASCYPCLSHRCSRRCAIASSLLHHRAHYFTFTVRRAIPVRVRPST